MSTKTKLLLLDDAKLVTMVLRNPNVIAAFPQLRTAAEAASSPQAKRGGCGSCRGGPGVAVMSNNHAHARQIIQQLPPADLNRLKEMLAAEKIRMYVRTSPNRVEKVTL